jgi:hypothetical protein
MDQKNNATSRREFVKQTSILAGGLMAAPLIASANYFSGSNDVIKAVAAPAPLCKLYYQSKM